MEDMIYPASLIVIALLVFILYQNNNSKLALLMLAIGVYIVYSHETGNTATDFKNDMVKSINEGAEDFTKSYDIEGYDANKAKDAVK
ncbi:MAG: hypothetical protein J7J96_09075 [Sulfurimonas sp.]|nr:hypothetical protein [Sulfurimonas sp.]